MSGGIADRLIVILVMQFIISSYRPKIPICTALQESNLCAQCTAEAIKSVQEMLPNSFHLLPCSPMFSHVHLPILLRFISHYFALLAPTFQFPPGSCLLSFLFANNRGDSFTRPSVCMFEKGYGDGSKPWYLVNPKIAGKWMFIPLKWYI